ncbi:class I SAM-dependent methyltransferase [Conexibacter sp. JD483]|uniref:class I SAM-dependent methyltransferase n=1 Tax=unclassified Conexibacter TaxID=2627773 RepID=UPI002722D14A|nr:MULTISPECIES: class I SAM-dependent methyltransferase [unclassified Conexibacter]MDO8185303.1 class I SAM-dependent methyltransferase [Conexibacter sp. CPCC 205706]MDO8198349.1 class I SAM-dependent methyltransferase [Conexibacter sp. CPCC 205762]MDR9370536.1 class I SAM-dependent methyltransferase [Conexibacter sp. JD483]
MSEPLLPAWDDQQAAYIADREGRFAIIASLVELHCGPAPLVVDLACGPGSLSARILAALPGARVLGVDHDPLLLELARRELAPRHDGRLTLLDADLEDAGWPAAVRAALGGARPDAIVSTTALHWLFPDRLVRLYGQAAELLADGGGLLNGDHFRFDGRTPTLRALAAAHDTATQQAAWAAGAPSWDAWWERAHAIDGGAALAAERSARFDHRPPPPPTAVDLHLAALAQAGFAEAGTVWQLLDDYVVAGFK